MRTKLKDRTVNIVTLGCSKNTVDSEYLARQLDANNLRVVHNQDGNKARTVIINTCGFIKDAKEESIDTILEYVQAKESGLLDNVYVMGCLSERYKPDLEKEIKNVDKYFGSNDLASIIETLGGNLKQDLLGERITTTPTHYSYFKIAEGCDRTCSFCAIPIMRGKHKSKPIESLIFEAEILAKKGTKELILIAQDLTYYGVDTYGKQELAKLLTKLAEVNGIEWIRLHYAYPASFPRDVIQVMKSHPNICNYLDIPFQHVADPVLKKMRRAISGTQTRELIDFFRQEIPNLALRTTLMVGHPGEDEGAFNELKEFVEKTKFQRLGVFTYSEEEQTYAARNFPDVISEEVKQKRAAEIMELQQSISAQLNQSLIGKTKKVIIDRREGNHFIGRTESDSPEVDNEVIISKSGLNIGEFYNLTITGAEDYDLFA